MCRGCEGWMNPVRFKCFSCYECANIREEIVHGETGTMVIAHLTEETRREELARYRNQGFEPEVDDNGDIRIPSVPCTSVRYDIRENPYLNDDGTEKPLDLQEVPGIAFIGYILILLVSSTAVIFFRWAITIASPEAGAYMDDLDNDTRHWALCNVLNPTDAEILGISYQTDC